MYLQMKMIVLYLLGMRFTWNLSSKLLGLILHIIKLGTMLGIMGHRAGVQELVKEKSFERFCSFSCALDPSGPQA